MAFIETDQGSWSAGLVRIAPGSAVDAGRVEIWTSEGWGTICQSSSFSSTWRAWRANEANVVCKQLNFTGGIPIASGAVSPGSHKQVTTLFHNL